MRILAAHAYGFINNADLGYGSQAVCEKILKVEKNYDAILLLGGWHYELLPARPTSAELMQQSLIDSGTLPLKLYTQFSLNLGEIDPARDTMEEVDLLPHMISELGFDRCKEFDAIGLWFHAPRIRQLYKMRRLNCQKIIRAFCWESLKYPLRIAQEPIGWLMNWWDPNGEGKFFKNLRDKRTHQTANPVT